MRTTLMTTAILGIITITSAVTYFYVIFMPNYVQNKETNEINAFKTALNNIKF